MSKAFALSLRRCWVVAALALAVAGGGSAHAATRAHHHPAAAAHHDLSLLERQRHAAERQALPARDDPLVVFVGAALDDASTAFAGDVKATEDALHELSPAVQTLALANGHGPRSWPRATRGTLQAAFADAARLLQRAPPGAPRLAVVLLTSHGARDLLSLETPSMREPSSLSTADVARLLRPLGDTPTLLVISACHAGSMIPGLAAPHRVIFAAARADRSSFGCQPDSRNTYFVEELLDAMRPERSLREWFDATAIGVGAREQRMRLNPPSQPQIAVGAGMQAAAQQPLAELLGSGSR